MGFVRDIVSMVNRLLRGVYSILVWIAIKTKWTFLKLVLPYKLINVQNKKENRLNSANIKQEGELL